jgi:hypothetical protein
VACPTVGGWLFENVSLTAGKAKTLDPWQMQAAYVIKAAMTATVLWRTIEIQSKNNYVTNILFINPLKMKRICFI